MSPETTGHDAARSAQPMGAVQSMRSSEPMRAALDAAREGVRGANPLVGAVLADQRGRVLHTAAHRGAGTAHAEAAVIAAARAAGTDLRHCVLYTSLEPCAHTGRTGPCAEAVLAAGIPEVVFADAETTPQAAGGAELLRRHGVRVTGGVLAGEARELNARWWRAQEEHRPFVTGKIAASLDGKVAAEDGTSQWITGPAARAHGHGLRARADAILCGTGTALADDPLLTARTPEGEPLPPEAQPRRAVMGLRSLTENARLHEGPGHLRLATRDPHEALTRLRAEGAGHVLIEGGPGLISAFLREDLVDELWWYTAPLLLGAGPPAVPDLGIPTLTRAQAWALDPIETQAGILPVGGDLALHLRPVSRPHSDSSPHSESRPHPDSPTLPGTSGIR